MSRLRRGNVVGSARMPSGYSEKNVALVWRDAPPKPSRRGIELIEARAEKGPGLTLEPGRREVAPAVDAHGSTRDDADGRARTTSLTSSRACRQKHVVGVTGAHHRDAPPRRHRFARPDVEEQRRRIADLEQLFGVGGVALEGDRDAQRRGPLEHALRRARRRRRPVRSRRRRCATGARPRPLAPAAIAQARNRLARSIALGPTPGIDQRPASTHRSSTGQRITPPV